MHPITARGALRALLFATGLLAMTAPAGVVHAGSISWGGERVQGNGQVTKQNRALGHFHALASSVSGDVEVRIGNTESVTVETDDNLQALLETVVENGTLRIRPARKNLSLSSKTMKIIVQARALDRVSVAGSGSVQADNLKAERLQLDVGGSGSLVARQLAAEAVTVALGGSGSLETSGKAERLQVSIGGSGEVHADKLATRDATVSIGGSGEVTVWATQSLAVNLAGSGDIGYYGDPRLSKSVVGSGSVKRLGAAPL
ncbi:MAG: head GIN domain-containing protein [Duganella sp.]